MSAAGPWGGKPNVAHEYLIKVQKVRVYCDMVGWELEEVHINADDIIDDASIGLLKIANVGDVIDGIGIRVSDEEYYVIRKPQF